MKEVPIIDISQNVSELVNQASTKWGFLVATGHGISKNLIDNSRMTYSF